MTPSSICVINMRWIRWRITESVASFCLSLFTRLFSSPSQLIVLTWQSDLSQFVSMRCRASINNFSPLCSVLLPPLRFWWARSSLPSQYCQRSNTSWSYLKYILSLTTVPCGSRPGLLNLSTPLAFGAGRFFAAGGCPAYCTMFRSIFPPHASSTLLPSCDSQKCFRTLPNAPHLGRRWKIASGLKPLLWRKKGGETVGILCLTSYFSSSPRMHLQSLSSFRIVKPPSSEAELALAFSLCLYLHVQSFPKTFHLVWGISFFSLCLSSVLDFELFEDKMWVSHLFISSV